MQAQPPRPILSAALAFVVALALVAAPASAATAAPHPDEQPADRWNLGDLYPSLAAWNTDAAKLDAQFAEFAGCKGRLGESVARFRRCLELQADMNKRYARLVVYSSEQLSEDTGAAASLELAQKADVLGVKLNEATSFVNPEVLKLGRKRVERMVAADRALAIHRHPLDDIVRMAPHTLDTAGESLVARFGLMSGAGGTAYSILTNADIPWPRIRLANGEEVELDGTGYTKYREVANRDDRRRVMDAFFGAYKTYERTLGVTLYSQLKEDAVFAKVRKYPDSITRSLDVHRIPVKVFDTLIRETDASLPTLHRYFRLRAKMLGVGEMQYYDIYPPLVRSELRYPLAEAKAMVLEAVAPLGREYVAAMQSGFASRWMDAYPRPKKQSGAHQYGIAYDVHPYVLMNYNGDYESVTTIAHEWGHAMHSYLTNHTQPFVTSDYATFVAEIASTVNEELLLDRMLKAARTDDERLLYLGSALEQLRGTFYRQAMFAEYERSIHADVDAGTPLTGEALTKKYCELLKRYHGTAEGVMAIDDAYCVEWAYIPHFYNAFYVYQYATSIAAASLFARRIRDGEPGALERYLTLLRAGGSDYPYELVKTAGVDLASPAPYRALVARMNAIMDEIEAILARRPAAAK
jgi:oligoendopeptidase F